MSYAAAATRFNRQAARFRQRLLRVDIQPRTRAGADDGLPLTVAKTPTRGVEQLTENGISIVFKAQFRVLKTSSWLPVPGSEFAVVATGEVYCCETASGGNTAHLAEIVCDAVRTSP